MLRDKERNRIFTGPKRGVEPGLLVAGLGLRLEQITGVSIARIRGAVLRWIAYPSSFKIAFVYHGNGAVAWACVSRGYCSKDVHVRVLHWRQRELYMARCRPSSTW